MPQQTRNKVHWDLDPIEEKIIGEINQQQLIVQIQQDQLQARIKDFAKMAELRCGLPTGSIGTTHEIVDGAIRARKDLQAQSNGQPGS